MAQSSSWTMHHAQIHLTSLERQLRDQRRASPSIQLKTYFSMNKCYHLATTEQ